MTTSIRYGDIGNIFLTTILDEDDAIVDLSSASPMSITFLDSESGRFVRTVGLYTDGTDGKTTYTKTALDTFAVGSVEYQVNITTGSSVYWSTINRFNVTRAI